MRKQSISKRRAILAGASSAFSIMGDGFGRRKSDNLENSWYNVGVYFKRAIQTVSKRNGHGERYTNEELETY